MLENVCNKNTRLCWPAWGGTTTRHPWKVHKILFWQQNQPIIFFKIVYRHVLPPLLYPDAPNSLPKGANAEQDQTGQRGLLQGQVQPWGWSGCGAAHMWGNIDSQKMIALSFWTDFQRATAVEALSFVGAPSNGWWPSWGLDHAVWLKLGNFIVQCSNGTLDIFKHRWIRCRSKRLCNEGMDKESRPDWCNQGSQGNLTGKYFSVYEEVCVCCNGKKWAPTTSK